MIKIEVELSDEEEKALTAKLSAVNGLGSIQDWVSNLVHNKARQHIDALVEEFTDKRASRLSCDEKNEIVRKAKVKTMGRINGLLSREATPTR